METVNIGLWGDDQNGDTWDFPPPSTDSSLKEIYIEYGEIVNLLRFTSIDNKTGATTTSGTFGGPGVKNATASIKVPTEYLISISGTTKPDTKSGHVVIESLTFNPSDNTKPPYGPYGPTPPTGSDFKVPIERGKVVGFFGRQIKGGHITAIGSHVIP
ncbi:hypothetical protein Dsin_022466 [Dipteronia sinensis]|uniref:Jacalin-type lectin domain-containing protein n=1 Tax=Dipteronia sinensis TaxID=43782 RepID=A0AAE0A2W4_9ROSI|nr:hypothetical protein Dsin_022466 [Dipteronia sinensis]